MTHNRTNAEWLSDLNQKGVGQDKALEDLRAILLRAAQKTLNRYLGDLQTHYPDTADRLSEDCAQEALISILAHLQDFQGDSKFSTWAYKFAVNIALTTARRERRKYIPLELNKDGVETDDWLFLREDKPFPDPDLPALKQEIWRVIRDVIQDDLTQKQQEVLKLMVFDEVPMDEVVERLKTNRNAVYKLLHDARRKIKLQLIARGINLSDALIIFSEED